MRIWYAEHADDPARKERQRLSAAAWYRENKEHRDKVRAAWIAANPDKARLYAQTRRARQHESAGEGLSADIVDVLLARQKQRCIACHCKLRRSRYEIDHVVPLSRGGPHCDANVQLLCRRCNRAKGAKPPEVFMQECGFLL